MALELPVERSLGVAELDGGPHRPQGVVVVRNRSAEDSHDDVADEPLHGATVVLEHSSDDFVTSQHHRSDRLWILPVVAGRGRRELDECDRDELSSRWKPRSGSGVRIQLRSATSDRGPRSARPSLCRVRT